MDLEQIFDKKLELGRISGVDRISGGKTEYCDGSFIKKFLISIQLESVRMTECPSICNMYELLITYCYSTKNLRYYASVCLKGFLFLNLKDYSVGYPNTNIEQNCF